MEAQITPPSLLGGIQLLRPVPPVPANPGQRPSPSNSARPQRQLRPYGAFPVRYPHDKHLFRREHRRHPIRVCGPFSASLGIPSSRSEGQRTCQARHRRRQTHGQAQRPGRCQERGAGRDQLREAVGYPQLRSGCRESNDTTGRGEFGVQTRDVRLRVGGSKEGASTLYWIRFLFIIPDDEIGQADSMAVCTPPRPGRRQDVHVGGCYRWT